MERHLGATNVNKTPVFIHILDSKANYKHLERLEIVKYSDLQTSQCYNVRLLKPKGRAYIVDRLTTARAEYPVTNYKDMRTTIHWFQQKLHTNSLHAWDNILKS